MSTHTPNLHTKYKEEVAVKLNYVFDAMFLHTEISVTGASN